MELFTGKYSIVLSISVTIFLLLSYSNPSCSSPSPGRTNPYGTNNQQSTSSSSIRTTSITSNHIRDNQVIPEVRPSPSTVSAQNESLVLNSRGNETGFSTCSDESVAAGKCLRPLGLDMKKLSLELIRHDILRKLRLDENKLPNATAIPKEYLNSLLTGIEMQNDSPQSQYDDDHATTEKIIAFSRTQPIKLNGKSLSSHHFTFTDKLLSMRIDTAMLHILVRFQDGANPLLRKGEFYIRVMQLVSEKRGESPVFNNYGPVKAITHPPQAGQNHFRHESSRWIQIDVRQVFSKWIANSPATASRKIALVFDVTDASQNHISDVSIVSGSDLNVNQNPFLEVEVSEEGRSRVTRDLGLDCLESSKETRCCRYPLTVDFDVFGWDWVIAPKQYEANYCSGECPFAFLQKYPHNHIVQQVNRGIGGPCCTARKLSPITMLHFDQDGNIVFSVLPGMLVDQCGCS